MILLNVGIFLIWFTLLARNSNKRLLESCKQLHEQQFSTDVRMLATMYSCDRENFLKGVRIGGESREEGLILELYLRSRGSGGHSPPEAMGY